MSLLNALITFRLDWLLLSLLGCAATLGLIRWLRARGPTSSIPRWIIYSVIPLLLLSGAFAELTGRFEHARQQQMLEGFAPTYARELARLGHARLPLDAPPDDPLYLSLIRAQLDWIALNPAAHDIYTFRKRSDGTVVLVVDAETDYDQNGRFDGDREQRTPIGETYPEADKNILTAFAGAHIFDDEPSKDRWGNWVNAYAPIYDEAGKVEAVLGVDYAADQWLRSIAFHRAIPLAAAAGMAAILLGSATAISLLKNEMHKRRRVEDRLSHEALHDPLTGLPNRTFFGQRLAAALERSRYDPSYAFAVLFLDLDRFKLVNDSLGHPAGDRFLLAVAQRLDGLIRQTGHANGVIARMGGDEFTILLEGFASSNEPDLIAEQILRELKNPQLLDEQEITTTVSIGIARGHCGYEQVEHIVRDADAAMYVAKASGRSCVVAFDPSMHAAAAEQFLIEADLRRSIERGELSVYYQPQVSLSTRKLIGFEALVRWRHPRRGLITPARFIPMAEEIGFIHELGLWVLETAARQLRDWHQANPHHHELTVSINLSARQLRDPSLMTQIRNVLVETGVDPSRIILELTESAVVQTDGAAETLEQLRLLGVRLHLDDFGSGYSSFSCLHRFHLDAIKIDRSFVNLMEQRRDYAAVMNAIVNLAQNLGYGMIAEGVETSDQAAMLQAMGCDTCQGYLFSPPVPAEVAVDFLQSGLLLTPHPRVAA